MLPPLVPDEVQLWRIEMAETAGLLEPCTGLLTPEEKLRAERLRPGRPREQFVLGRAGLRLLLGRVLGCDPRSVPILAGPHGKPLLPPSATPALSSNRVSFNLAHAKSTILIALRPQGAVGVDIEDVTRATEVMDVARHAFTPGECLNLEQLRDETQQRLAFFRLWTRKEAVVKADGRGLSLSLSSFEVPIDAAESTPIRVSVPDEESAKLYFLSDVFMGDDLAGAVAVDHKCSRITLSPFPLHSFL